MTRTINPNSPVSRRKIVLISEMTSPSTRALSKKSKMARPRKTRIRLTLETISMRPLRNQRQSPKRPMIYHLEKVSSTEKPKTSPATRQRMILTSATTLCSATLKRKMQSQQHLPKSRIQSKKIALTSRMTTSILTNLSPKNKRKNNLLQKLINQSSLKKKIRLISPTMTSTST